MVVMDHLRHVGHLLVAMRLGVLAPVPWRHPTHCMWRCDTVARCVNHDRRMHHRWGIADPHVHTRLVHAD